MSEDIKKWSKCKTFSSRSIFFKDTTKVDGYRKECRFCINEYQ